MAPCSGASGRAEDGKPKYEKPKVKPKYKKTWQEKDARDKYSKRKEGEDKNRGKRRKY